MNWYAYKAASFDGAARFCDKIENRRRERNKKQKCEPK